VGGVAPGIAKSQGKKNTSFLSHSNRILEHVQSLIIAGQSRCGPVCDDLLSPSLACISHFGPATGLVGALFVPCRCVVVALKGHAKFHRHALDARCVRAYGARNDDRSGNKT
jgi:hypothetical protein